MTWQTLLVGLMVLTLSMNSSPSSIWSDDDSGGYRESRQSQDGTTPASRPTLSPALDRYFSFINASLSRLWSQMGRLQIGNRRRRLRNCQYYHNSGQGRSGIFEMDLLDGYETFDVYCDMETDDKGWAVFQRRKDGSVDFRRNWTHYASGFGNLNDEHWLGNVRLHRLTAAGMTRLRVDMTHNNGTKFYAEYSHFTVSDSSDKYRMTVSGYRGTSGESLMYHSGMQFSTMDQDNDIYLPFSIAALLKAGWWYKDTTPVHLNGEYKPGIRWPAGNYWFSIHNRHGLRFSEMKVR